VPIVASAVGGVPELLTNESNGILVEKRNRSALTAAIMRLAKDRELCRVLAARAKVEAEKYSPERHYESILRLYTAVCGSTVIPNLQGSAQQAIGART
jgi:glycosyltransferase involved in cell wall biosynthesis